MPKIDSHLISSHELFTIEGAFSNKEICPSGRGPAIKKNFNLLSGFYSIIDVEPNEGTLLKVPAVAKRSYEELKSTEVYADLVENVVEALETQSEYKERVLLIHQLIDQLNEDVFNHPLVKQLSPCKAGCSACCYTQVSVTMDEALLLRDKVLDGIPIDEDRLQKQLSAGDSSEEFYNLAYKERKCVFLDDEGKCKVYQDRPSVCRTNAVLGEAAQCGTQDGPQKTVLVKTSAADMVIYGFYKYSKESGALPHLLADLLKTS